MQYTSMKKFPLYKIKIKEDDTTGVDYVALVDVPAIGFNWQTFNANKQRYQVVNEEKRILAGAAMVADLPIYRRDETGYEYYVVFDRQTIEKIVQKLCKNGFIANVNLMHNESEKVEGIYLTEHFIIDAEKGKPTPLGFDKLTDGSWFVYYKCENDKVWQEVKEGKYKGFSVEGYFEQEFVKEVNESELINKSENIHNSKFNKMQEKLDAIKKLLFDENVEEKKFMDAKLNDGTIVRVTGEVAEGSMVEVIAEDGTTAPIADGEYTLEDGTVIKTEAGIITSVTAPKEEEAATEVDMSKFVSVDDFNKVIEEVKAEFKLALESIISQNTKFAEIQKAQFEVIEKIAGVPATEATEKKEVKKQATNAMFEAINKVRNLKKD